MKRVVLIKQHPCVQLAHLYEHLFVTQVDELMYSHGLYKWLDYSARGTTYGRGGVIEIDFELYTPDAEKMMHEIEHLKVNTEGEKVSRALAQLIAEESEKLYITDKGELLRKLDILSKEPWRNATEIGMIDTKAIRHQSRPIYLTTDKVTKPRLLSLELVSEKSLVSPKARVLFSILSGFLLYTVADRVAREGYYVGDRTAKPQKGTRKAELIVANQLASVVDINQVLTISLEAINKMRKGSSNKLLDAIRKFSLDNPIESPDREKLHADTFVYVGDNAWDSIADARLLDSLFASTKLSVSFGRKRVSAQL